MRLIVDGSATAAGAVSPRAPRCAHAKTPATASASASAHAVASARSARSCRTHAPLSFTSASASAAARTRTNASVFAHAFASSCVHAAAQGSLNIRMFPSACIATPLARSHAYDHAFDHACNHAAPLIGLCGRAISLCISLNSRLMLKLASIAPCFKFGALS